jgi:predicted nucleotidyltransferase component of viral defense system
VFDPRFRAQVSLVIRCLPEAAKHDCFALKGGTAINLFVRDLPRVSVDIDLTYLPLKSRDESLREISDTLQEIRKEIETALPGARVSERHVQGYVAKLSVSADDTEIKIEPNLVLRGGLSAPTVRELCPLAQEHFQAGARIQTMAETDLYGGKLCAALDRQHPRDLFDVGLLLRNEGITPAIRRAFVVYLASHTRPMHELLQPTPIDITDAFERQFIGMTLAPVTMDEIMDARHDLVESVVPSLDDSERTFLLSMKSGDPDWHVLGIEGLENMPALQWKLLNIRKMDGGKREEQLRILRDLLYA